MAAVKDERKRGVLGNDPSVQTQCTAEIRNLLSDDDTHTHRRPTEDAVVRDVIDAGLLSRWVELLRQNRDDTHINPVAQELQSECVRAITAIASRSETTSIVAVLRAEGVVPAFVGLLAVMDPIIVALVLRGLDTLLRAGGTTTNEGSSNNTVVTNANEVVSLVSDAGGLETIEDLQDHFSNDIYEMATHILSTHFGSA